MRAFVTEHRDELGRCRAGQRRGGRDGDDRRPPAPARRCCYDGGFVGVTWPAEAGRPGRHADAAGDRRPGAEPRRRARAGQPDRHRDVRTDGDRATAARTSTRATCKPAAARRRPVVPAVQRAGRRAATSPALRTRAVPTEDGTWRINGQKVWTTLAHVSRLRHRAHPHRPRRRQAPRADDVRRRHEGARGQRAPAAADERRRPTSTRSSSTTSRSPDTERLGDVGDGWRVALTTLMSERLTLGGGGTELGIGIDRRRRARRRTGSATLARGARRRWPARTSAGRTSPRSASATPATASSPRSAAATCPARRPRPASWPAPGPRATSPTSPCACSATTRRTPRPPTASSTWQDAQASLPGPGHRRRHQRGAAQRHRRAGARACPPSRAPTRASRFRESISTAEERAPMNFDLDDEQRDLAAAAARLPAPGTASPAAARAALEAERRHRSRPGSGRAGRQRLRDHHRARGRRRRRRHLLDLAVVAEQAGRVLAGPSLVTFARAAVLLADDAARLRRAGRRQRGRTPSSTATGPVLDAAGRRHLPGAARRRPGAAPAGHGRRLGDPIDPTRGLGRVDASATREVVAAGRRGRAGSRAEQVGRVVLAAEGLGAAGPRASSWASPTPSERHAFGRRDRLLPGGQALPGRRLRAGRAAALAGLVGRLGRRPRTRRAAAGRRRRQGGRRRRRCEQAAETLIQVHGGIGFTWEHDAHLYWRRAKVDRFLLGDEVAAYDEVARALAPGRGGATTRGEPAVAHEHGSHHLARLGRAPDERRSATTSRCSSRAPGTPAARSHERSARVAGGLRRLGVGAGDRVIVLMMNTPEVFITYQAVWRAGRRADAGAVPAEPDRAAPHPGRLRRQGRRRHPRAAAAADGVPARAWTCRSWSSATTEPTPSKSRGHHAVRRAGGRRPAADRAARRRRPRRAALHRRHDRARQGRDALPRGPVDHRRTGCTPWPAGDATPRAPCCRCRSRTPTG